jgi:hypothetical protein
VSKRVHSNGKKMNDPNVWALNTLVTAEFSLLFRPNGVVQDEVNAVGSGW